MKIACLYFPTSSVGGIATNVAALRAEAKRRGDTFHVLVCGNAKTHKFETFSKPKRIRGGDTFIDIDGYASHHAERVGNAAAQINKYDLVYLAFLCPHPTKAYGDVPVFLDLLRRIERPIVGHITDGYYESYKAWGDETAALCTRIVVDQPAYLPEGYQDRSGVVYGRPFDYVGLGYPHNDTPRSEGRSMCWIAQWKAIKGIHRLLPLLPSVEGEQNLYSNGILYYQLRSEPEWEAAVGADRFKPEFSGKGRAMFHGWQPMEEVRKALEYSWFMCEFQGLGRPSYAAYRNGSLNHTIVEALYYGCTPVIPQITIDYAGIPPEAAIGVRSYEEAVPALNGDRAPKPELGRQWVLDNFAVNGIYDKMFGGIL
jgi:hypothetical protein